MGQFLRGRSAPVKPGAPTERFGALKALGLKHAELLPGHSWLYWGASTPQKLSIRASGPFGVLKALGLKRFKPPRHFRPASTPPWDLLYFLLCPMDHLRWCLFFSPCAPLSLSLSLSFTWSHSCKPFCLCPAQAFLRWMKQCGP